MLSVELMRELSRTRTTQTDEVGTLIRQLDKLIAAHVLENGEYSGNFIFHHSIPLILREAELASLVDSYQAGGWDLRIAYHGPESGSHQRQFMHSYKFAFFTN